MPFDNFSARSLKLSNRIELVPMKRSRATPAHAPDALMATYYRHMSTFYVAGAKGYTDYPTLTVATGALA